MFWKKRKQEKEVVERNLCGLVFVSNNCLNGNMPCGYCRKRIGNGLCKTVTEHLVTMYFHSQCYDKMVTGDLQRLRGKFDEVERKHSEAKEETRRKHEEKYVMNITVKYRCKNCDVIFNKDFKLDMYDSMDECTSEIKVKWVMNNIARKRAYHNCNINEVGYSDLVSIRKKDFEEIKRRLEPNND